MVISSRWCKQFDITIFDARKRQHLRYKQSEGHNFGIEQTMNMRNVRKEQRNQFSPPHTQYFETNYQMANWYWLFVWFFRYLGDDL